jgi:putative SOS response-associated peptidase YedK
MCGRYTMFLKPDDLKKRFRASVSDEVAQKLEKPRYNLAPTQDVPIITMQNGERIADMVRWGLIPSWAKDESIGSKLINARSETLTEKPSFKNAFQKRRCLVVANGFYEWKASAPGERGRGRTTPKQPMYIRLTSGEPFAMAGLWESWKNPQTQAPVRSCTIITTEPNDLIATLHHRMAVILTPADEDLWLDESLPTQELMRLLKPFPSDALEAYPVSTRVNSPALDNASLIEQADSEPFESGMLF